jgi:abortive infection bacteriophage resistance protein
MFPFKQKVDGKIVDKFKDGTTWIDVYHMYVFDRKLRLLVFDAIEKIEVAVRSQVVYHLSHKYGSHWQDKAEIFAIKKVALKDGTQKEVRVFDEIQKHIKEQLSSSQTELFIEHYRDTYHKPVNPPSWMCVEIMYFNQLSKICSYLKERSDVTAIASHFGLPPKVFTSWLHSINYVRNICAHHSRLWNRDLKIAPANLAFSKSCNWLANPEKEQRGKIYYFLCILNYILQSVNPKSSFKMRLKELITEYKPRISAMGFPENWAKEEIWR